MQERTQAGGVDADAVALRAGVRGRVAFVDVEGDVVFAEGVGDGEGAEAGTGNKDCHFV